MKTALLAAATTLAIMSTTAPAAAAPIIGDTVTCSASGFFCAQSKATVGAGTEFTSNGFTTPFLSFDFASDLLTITNTAGFDFGTTFNTNFAFRNLDHAFTGAALIANNGFGNLSQANFTVSGGVLSMVSTDYFNATRNATVTLRLSADNPATAAVPEPASWAMLILGLGAVGMALRKRRATVRFA